MIHDTDIRLETIQWYQAPRTTQVTPNTIKSGLEYLELIVGGTVYFEVDGVMDTFRFGSLFWHIPGEQTICLTTPDDPYECVVFKFQRQGPIQRSWPRALHLRDQEKACEFARDMLAAFHDERSDRGALTRHVYSWLEWNARQSVLRSKKANLPGTLLPLINLIDRNPERDFSISEMARVTGLSAPHIHTLFKQHLGTTPHQYVLTRRLNFARHLIVSTDTSIKQVCTACGFDNIETFYRCFRNRFSSSPGEFRRQNRPN